MVIQDYALAYFDILGFQKKFEALGLSSMLEKYRLLIAVVNEINAHTNRLFDGMSFKESVYWTAEGDVVPFVKVHGAYASDSLLVWTSAAWPEARDKAADERSHLADDPDIGWVYQTVPCDTLVRTCNELVCRALELGLPLRGSLAMGRAVLDADEKIFLGQPLMDAARLEKGQKLIGGSCCASFVTQRIPERFVIPYSNHLKKELEPSFGGLVIDWPRHWRKTRDGSVSEIIANLRQESLTYAEYYDNTLAMLSLSEARMGEFESPQELSIRSSYPAFATPTLKAHARAVRKA